MKNKDKSQQIVICPPCGEQPSAPEGFNPGVALATKRGLFNKVAFLTTPHRPFGALPPQVGKLTSSGFTLIELLVVVLIIGILAAVAVPQYQKAVEKSKSTQALTLLKAVGQAADVYYLANGVPPTKFEQLDIALPADWTGTEQIYDYYITDARSNGEWSIVLGNQPSWEQVMVGRISGTYKGAAFGYYLNKNNAAYTSRIICKEIKGSSSYIYSSALPSYCQTFFGAKLISGDFNKLYEMP